MRPNPTLIVSFLSLTIGLNSGKLQTPESSFAAFIQPSGAKEVTDITEEIRAAGLDPFAVADTPPFVTPAMGHTEAMQRLEKLGAVEKEKDDYIAKWTVQRKLSLPLSPGEKKLTLTYKARPAYTLLSYERLSNPDYLGRYCLAPNDIARLLGASSPSRMLLIDEYSISVSIDRKSPGSVQVGASQSGQEGMQPVVAFCRTDGKPVASSGSAWGAARPDSAGMVHILSITNPEKPHSASAPPTARPTSTSSAAH